MPAKAAACLAVAISFMVGSWGAQEAQAADPVIAAAGDVSCSSTTVQTDRCHQKATSDLLVNAGLSAVLVLGDAQYQNGGLSDFMNYYDKSWGRVKSITYPAVGNHEYQTSGAAGYFDYFNGVGNSTGRAGDRSKGYYSFDVGTWHLISLNSNDQCTIVSCSAGSPQETWLKADLAAHPNYCTLAYWHHPSFNSGNGGNLTAMQPMLQDLYNADADVLLGGHAHHYERFAPQNPSSQLDNARGIRQFVVGTGGAFWTAIGTPKPNSQVRQNTTYGVLKLTLHPTSYDWQFVPEAGKTFTDSGSTACHGTNPPPGGSDTQKPTAPAGLTATGGPGKVDLSWQASTDNVGVTGYRIYRGATQIASIGATTTYSDTGLTAGTYSYTVRAVDAAGNLSDPSNAATGTAVTPLAVFTLSPNADAPVQESSPTTNYATGDLRTDAGTGATVDSYLRFTVSGATAGVRSAKLRVYAYSSTADGPAVYTTGSTWSETTLNWNNRPPPTSAATDDKGAIASNSWVEYDVSPFVTGNGTYAFRLAQTSTDGVDFYSREAATLRPELVVTADTEAPTAPSNLSATAGTDQVSLSWQASTDNVGVTGYRIYRGGSEIATIGATTSYSDAGLAPGSYSYTVRAVDAAGNLSDPSNTASATVADTTKPTAPAGLSATGGASKVELSWQASSDDVGVTGYKVYRGGSEIASIGATTSYSDAGLEQGTYSYTVRAVDAAGNLSDPSNTASATVADSQKPTAPGNLSATPGTGKVDLAWQASTDNVGVTGYKVYRGGTEIASIGATTSYSDTGLAPGTYSYTVRAVDGAGNLSDPSNTASATVSDTQRPTAPANLTATARGSFRVDLSWQASTDNVGVTGYDIYRDGLLIASIGTTTSYSDTTVLPGFTYRYEVKALDGAGNVSDPSNTATVTVSPLDLERPSAPGNLTATSTSSSKVDLAWQASTDNVGVTEYRVYRDGTLIATTGATTSYSDTSVAATVTYDYVVRAVDDAGNVSDPSNTASATVPDTEKPTAPGNLNAARSGSQVDLDWAASSDNVAVTGYKVYRGNNEIASIGATTSYSDTGIAPGSYSYTVRAVDAAGNLSDPSSAASVTVSDTTRPSTPANLSATPGSGKVDLEWQASTDDVAVTGYKVYRGGNEIASIGATTSYSDTGIAPGSYSYTVRAVDAAGNLSDPSSAASVTVSDTTKPSAPANLHASAANSFQVDLSWQASSDNVGVTGYEVYRDGTLIATIGPTTSYADRSVTPATYSYAVRALDAAGNVSDPSNTAIVTVSPPDSEPPSRPSNLSATSTSSGKADLSWQASTDNVQVAGYEVFRDGTLIATTGATTSYSDTSVAATVRYDYTVRALDAAGNVSDPSNTATVTVPDTVKPTTPANLSATAGSAKVDLAWQASTDNVGVTGYKIYRGGTEIASIGPTASYSDTGLAPGTYSYSVRAVDGAGNLSDASSAASATIGDTQKPTVPAGLNATAASAGRVDLAWQGSTDNVGVTGYRIYRGETEIASIGATTSYSDTSVLANSTYSYEVRALDAAGNLSDPSNTATATTPPASSVLTLSPDADARVQQGSPTTNYGTGTLGADFSTGTSNIESFLRFTVSGLSGGAVVSAKLRLHSTSDGTADGPAVYTTSATWSETTVTWNTRPAATSSARDDKGAIAANSWVEYDVTPFVTGDGTYSFRIATSSTDGVYFSSREAADFRPELVLTTGTPDTQKPAAPASLNATAPSSSRIDLSWLASTDNVGVTGYNVYRGGTMLAGLGPVTSYSDTSVAASTTYSYQVRALDAAANLSDPSNTATATTPAPPPAPTVLTFSPDADARVEQGTATTNYGTSYLRADGASGAAVESYLRFTVSGVPPGSALTAKMRVRSTTNGTVDGPAIYTTGTAWSETTINWNNRPAATSAATDDKGAIPPDTWAEYDVTQFVTGNGTYAFKLATTSTDGVNFNAREAASLRPELVLTLG